MAPIKTVADNGMWFYAIVGDDIDTVLDRIDAITLADLDSAIEGSFEAAANGTRFSFTASDTFSDPAYGDESSANVPGRSNYEGSIATFIKVDDTTGAYDGTGSVLREAVIEKGTRVLIVSGITGNPREARAAGDLYDALLFWTDSAQRPTDVSGWRKDNIPLLMAGRSAASKALVAGA